LKSPGDGCGSSGGVRCRNEKDSELHGEGRVGEEAVMELIDTDLWIEVENSLLEPGLQVAPIYLHMLSDHLPDSYLLPV